MKSRHSLLLFFTALTLFVACQNTKKDEHKQQAPDSVTVAGEESMINKMVDEMAPPDSNYSGDFFLKYDNGLMKAKGYFRFGKRHGQWFYYYPNGYLWSDGFFENGKMNGPTKVYYENGKMYYEGEYRKDISVGTWNFYDSTGVLVRTRVYDTAGKLLSDRDVTPLPLKKDEGQ